MRPDKPAANFPPFVWVVVDELGAIAADVFSVPRNAEAYAEELNERHGPKSKTLRYRLDPE